MTKRRLLGLSAIGAVVLVALLAISARSPQATDAGDAQPEGVALHFRWDWNKDGCPDFYDSFPGGINIYVGTCANGQYTFGNAKSMGVGGVDQFLLVGDWNRDGCNDMVWVIGTGLYLGEGDCGTGFEDIEPPFMGDASDYNYFVAPGLWDGGNFLPDLLARRTSDKTLVLLSGDGNTSFAEPVEIGFRWDSAQIIVGLGDFDGDVCGDLGAVRRDDHTLRFYPGDCHGGFKDVGGEQPIIGGSTDWSSFDWLVAGGDWFPVAGQTCPDIMGWRSKSPSSIVFLPGNCDGKLLAGGGALSSTDPFNAPFPSDNSTLSTWGDGDCGYSVAPRDGQADLAFFLQQPPVTQEYGCPPLGTQVTVSGTTHLFGDWDCNGAISPRDGQLVLNAFLGKPPLSQTPPCPALRKPVPLFVVR